MSTLTCTPKVFFKKATATAHHYGFASLDELAAEQPKDAPEIDGDAPARNVRQGAIPKTKDVLDARQRRHDSLCGELAQTMQQIAQKNLLTDEAPLLLYHSALREADQSQHVGERLSFGLQVVGTKDAIAEALLIRASLATLEDLGAKDLCVHVNSIGCRDSSAKFQRELVAFLRRHIDELPQQAIQYLKEDPFLALSYLKRKRHPTLANMPRPMEFLTSASRRHLRDVLEFLEAAGIPYELDDLLVGHRDVYTQTIFDVRVHTDDEELADEPAALARGGRYDELARRFLRSTTPAAGTLFSLATNAVRGGKKVELVFDTPRRKPRAFFIHLGPQARLQSLSVIETLRKARVPLRQSLQSSGLSDQLASAERMRVPYTIIMGHKEALDGCVIVRDTATRCQHTVPLSMLPNFFKSVK